MNQFTAPIWGDEGFSAILSMKSIPEIISIVARDTSPPLYNITEHLWFQAFGTSEVAIRSLSFLYYILACFFVYKIGSFLWDKKTGALAAALSFFNPFFFIYAFEGRMYSILALGVVASMYFYIKLLKSKSPDKLDKIGYVLATAWALYSHHFAIFALFVQGFWFLYELAFGNRKFAKTIFKLFIAVGIIYIPWIIPLYTQTRMVGSGFWLGTPTAKDLLGLMGRYLAAGTTNAPAKPALFLILLLGIVRIWTKKTKSTLFLLSWFFIPIVAAWAISQVFQSIFFDRYLIHTIPAVMLIAASNRRKNFSIALLGVILSLFLVMDFYYFTHPTKRPFDKFAQVVKEDLLEGDLLVNWNAGSHHLWETKYYGIPASIYVDSQNDLPFFVGTALMEDKDIIRELPKNTKRVGAITSGNIDEISLPGYTKTDQKAVGDLKIVWFQK